VNLQDPQTVILMCVIVVAIVGALVLVARERRRARSKRLQARFGPEYARSLETAGDREKAEAELAAREKRVEQLKLVALPAAEAARFAQAWEALQARFVDDPTTVVGEADQLVRDLMHKRGYPMGDFEHRAADLSVHHASVVENYRAAQAIASRNSRGGVDTEELRRAVVHYRALFDELLETRPVRPTTARPTDNRNTVES
jgi:hypothetical protein